MRLAGWGLVAVLALAAATRAGAADQAVGKKVYAERCSPCHGDTGDGNGPAAAAIKPPPRNFRDPGFWQGRTAAQLKVTVRDGRPGTMMSPFAGTLSEAEIDAVVAYVATFGPAGH